MNYESWWLLAITRIRMRIAMTRITIRITMRMIGHLAFHGKLLFHLPASFPVKALSTITHSIMLRNWSTHCCNAPYVKVQEAEESKLGESAEDGDEADDDEDVQSGCIRYLIMMMTIMISLEIWWCCCDDEHHLGFSFATKANGDNGQSAGGSKSSPGSCLMTHVGLDQPEGHLIF